MNDDAHLLREFADHGSETAFAELVRRHVDLVHSAARRQVAGDVHRAEEVTQAVFVELARQARRLTTHRSLAGWLYTTARFVAARNQRAEQRRVLRENAAQAMNDTVPNPAADPTPAWNDLRPLLDEAMHRLSSADREAVVLRFFQNQPLAQVGHVLGLAENAARMRVDRALERLRRDLARRGISSTAAALSAALAAHAATPAPAGLATAVCASAVATPPLALGLLGLCELTAALMTTKKWLALSALVLTGAAVGPRLLPPPPPPAPMLAAEFSDPAPTPSPPGVNLAAGFRWDAIETGEYRQYIANLRASGAPEQLVRDVVSLELLRTYAPRYRELAEPTPQRAYWQKPDSRPPSAAQQERRANLSAEITTILQGLFGPQVGLNEAYNVLYTQPAYDSIMLAWLPREVADQVRITLAPILRQDEVNRRSTETGGDQERRLQRHLEALESVLNPAQLQEYRHRNSPAQQILKLHLRYWDPTEQEFLRLTKVSGQFLDTYVTRMEELREREATVQGLFDRERAESLLRALDPSYGHALTYARQVGLPPDTADQVWDTKRAALAEDERLRLHSGLSGEPLQRERAALVQRTESRFTELMGPVGLRSLKQDWPWWQALEKP